MRILVCHLTFGTHLFGGVERSMVNLVDGLLELGHAVAIFTGRLGGELDAAEFTSKTPRVYRSDHLIKEFPIDPSQIDDAILNNYRDQRREIRADFDHSLRDFQPDRLLVIDPLWGIVHHIVDNPKRLVPTSLLVHMVIGRQYFDFDIEEKFDAVAFVSEDVSNKFRELFPSCQLHQAVIPNSIRPVEFDAGSPPKAKILFGGRLTIEKGFDDFLRALRTVRSEQEAEIVFFGGRFHFGSNDREKALLQRVRNALTESKLKLRVEEEIGWDRVRTTMDEVGLVVIPSYYESFGMIALEAMARGVSVISTKSGNLGTLLNGYAHFVDTDAPEALAKAMSTLIARGDLIKRNPKGPVLAANYRSTSVAERLVTFIAHSI